MLTRLAFWWIRRQMQKDDAWAWTWHCNVAMAAQDAGAPHDRANERASDFMYRAFGVKGYEPKP